MNLINTTTFEYPRSLWQLRQEHPNVSFSANPTDNDLAPFDHANVHPTPKPALDTRTERLNEGDPVQGDDGRWQQTWTTRPATEQEIEAWDNLNASAPDWMTFGIDLITQATVGPWYDQLPKGFANGLSLGLKDASNGDPRLFVGIWQRLLAANAIPVEVITAIGELAVIHNLPPVFIGSLSAAPAAA